MRPSRNNGKEISTFGELFCGPGGMSLGAKLGANAAGFKLKHSWAIDIDPNSVATYNRNLGPEVARVLDVREARFADRKEFPRVDGMGFGFPCNDFSLVGERLGVGGKYGSLHEYCAEAVQAIQPAWFVAENVGGLRSADEGRTLRRILSGFEDLGYKLVAHLYRFEEYGIPQRRHRVLIVGISKKLRLRFRVPSPTNEVVSAQKAIEIPPIPEGAANNEHTRMAPQVIARLNHIRPGENAFTSSLPANLRLNVVGATISQIYRRLDPEKPAYTITGSGGGGTHVYHWSQPRALTNRERARLQTFPDDFVFEGGKEAVRRQIGMAVPPAGAALVFTALFRTLAGKPYPSVEPSIHVTKD